MILAVYGTLKKGYPLHGWVKNEKFIKNDIVRGELYVGSYPFLLKGNDKVDVEVYDVQENSFNMIKDMEEGAGYKTELTKLHSGDTAYVFFYPKKLDYFKKIDKF